MKHCPNSDCESIITYGVVAEYRDDVQCCAHCESDLVDGPDSRAKPHQVRGSEPSSATIMILFGAAGAALGVVVGAGSGTSGATLWLGLGLGVLAARLRAERTRNDSLSQALGELADRIARLEQGGPSPRDESPGRDEAESTASIAPSPPPQLPPADSSVPASPRSQAPPDPPAHQRRRQQPAAPRRPSPLDQGIGRLRDWLFGGNTVVRGGVLVLLVGITLLARWAAENSLLPIEARLVSAAFMGLALVVVGYRLRESRPGFGTTLQGGGLAALYLVSFMSFRLYELLPVGFAFPLFVVIAAASGTLAVLQRALPLIVIASLGGFLAPILASTGSGNHVALFSYYLVLNVSIAAIAFARSWRVLNLLAFVCTYGVATAWGVLSYEPDHLMSTLPFVAAFLVLFTSEALLFAWRQPPNLRGIVDGSLVFGTPLVTLLASAALLQEVEMGLAIATAGMALFYVGIAIWLWRTAPETLRQLSESFVALAVGLGTMAVPFAFEDSPTTAIVWALEGAGIHWVGVRQARRSARLAGLALQPLAALAFSIWLIDGGAPATRWIANGRFLSALALAFAGLAIAREADHTRSELDTTVWGIAQIAGVWGLAWWGYGAFAEISDFLPARFSPAACVALIGASAVALHACARGLIWESGGVMSMLSIPVAGWAILLVAETQPSVLIDGGFIAWPFCLASIYWILLQLEESRFEWTSNGYAVWLWLSGAFVALALKGLADHTLALNGDWGLAGLGLGLGSVAAASLHAIESGWGAFGRFRRVHFSYGVGPVLLVGLLWIFATNFAAQGATAPLPYLPLLNPIDLAISLVAVSCCFWILRLSTVEPRELFERSRPLILSVTAFLTFCWLNAILARSVAQWTGVAYRMDALWNSVALQVCLSIAWTLVGFAGMWFSTHRQLRRLWMGFASLLGITVAKLFVVDLSQLTTPAKIVTFLVVGLLLLIVGYLSPVPPEVVNQEEGGDVEPGSAADSPGGGTSSLVVWLAFCLAATTLGAHSSNAQDAAPLERDDFAWSRAIELTSSNLIQVVELPYEIYRGSVEPGLADLRVFDSTGTPVPHAIAKAEVEKEDDSTLTSLPLFRLPHGKTATEILLLGEKYRVDVRTQGMRATVQLAPSSQLEREPSDTRAYLVDASKLEGELVGIEFDIAPQNADFLIPFRVEATEDFAHYTVVTGAAVIAQLAGEKELIEQRRVRFRRTKAKYLKISWPPNMEAPAITGIQAVQRAPEQKVRRLAADIEGESLGAGSFLFEPGGWPPIDQLQIGLGDGSALVSAEVFRADQRAGPWQRIHHGLVYRFGSDGEPGSQNEPIALTSRRAGLLRIDIASKGGGASRPAPMLSVEWPPEHLYFVDQGDGPYTLTYGKAGASAARFNARELLSIHRRVVSEEDPIVPTAKLGSRVSLKGQAALEPDTHFPTKQLLLWAVLIGSVAIVAGLAIRLVREMRG